MEEILDRSSTLLTSTNDVSVRTNRADRYENQSEMVDFFLLQKNHPKSIKKGWCFK